MKAAVADRYGPPDVIRIADVPLPAVGPHDIRVRVRAATVSTADRRIRTQTMPRGFGLLGRLLFGLAGPRQPILGTDLAGDVEAIGPGVTTFSLGQAVIAATGARFGSHAEYRTLRADGAITVKPANLSYEAAAALVFGGSTALHFLRDRIRLQRGERVLIVGASGAVGSAAVQIARDIGAVVTGVCSAANHELVRSLGAQSVVDYRTADALAAAAAYDAILDTTGTVTYATARHALADRGRLALLVASLPDMFAALRAIGSGKRVVLGAAPETAEILAALARMAEAGHFVPVIDSIHRFENIAAAHARVDSGVKRGNVVVALPAS